MLDIFFFDEAGIANRLPDFAAERAVLVAVGATVVVELDIELGEVPLVGRLHVGNELGFAVACLSGAYHDCRAMGIVGTKVTAIVAEKFLKSDPDIGLQILDQMANVDMAIGVGQGGSDKNTAFAHRLDLQFENAGSASNGGPPL